MLRVRESWHWVRGAVEHTALCPPWGLLCHPANFMDTFRQQMCIEYICFVQGPDGCAVIPSHYQVTVSGRSHYFKCGLPSHDMGLGWYCWPKWATGWHWDDTRSCSWALLHCSCWALYMCPKTSIPKSAVPQNNRLNPPGQFRRHWPGLTPSPGGLGTRIHFSPSEQIFCHRHILCLMPGKQMNHGWLLSSKNWDTQRGCVRNVLR